MITKAIVGGVKIASTKPGGGGWLTSGTVPFFFTFNDGRSVTVELEFRDQPSEDHAVKACANSLYALASAMQDLASRHM
jgi:hypothetical protein